MSVSRARIGVAGRRVALASSSQRARGGASIVSVSPSAIRSAPAQAIIAPLSVHSAGGGMISVVCAFAATSCNAPRMAWLAATPPAATSARGGPNCS